MKKIKGNSHESIYRKKKKKKKKNYISELQGVDAGFKSWKSQKKYSF